MTNLQKARKYPHTIKQLHGGLDVSEIYFNDKVGFDSHNDRHNLGWDIYGKASDPGGLFIDNVCDLDFGNLRPILNLTFKDNFVPDVQAGIKLQTIRGKACKVGDALHFYKGRYTKPETYKMFGWGICSDVAEVSINQNGLRLYGLGRFVTRTDLIEWKRLDDLAHADGFESASAMKAWFEQAYCKKGELLNFEGYLIKWKQFNAWNA